jgi:hypothetical protein
MLQFAARGGLTQSFVTFDTSLHLPLVSSENSSFYLPVVVYCDNPIFTLSGVSLVTDF